MQGNRSFTDASLLAHEGNNFHKCSFCRFLWISLDDMQNYRIVFMSYCISVDMSTILLLDIFDFTYCALLPL